MGRAQPLPEISLKRTVTLLLLLTCLASRAAAQADSAGHAVAAAQAAAGEWLALVDGLRYEESWDSAAALFRDKVSKPAWKAAVRQARGPLEPFGARSLISAAFTTTLPEAPPGQYVVLQYETGVAGGRTVVETVTPRRDPDGRWRVSGYYVRPR